jgi:hypothetical protein
MIDLKGEAFQSYHSGIEIPSIWTEKGVYNCFQSYHSGIEITPFFIIKLSSPFFQSYHSGIEIHFTAKRVSSRNDLPIVP